MTASTQEGRRVAGLALGLGAALVLPGCEQKASLGVYAESASESGTAGSDDAAGEATATAGTTDLGQGSGDGETSASAGPTGSEGGGMSSGSTGTTASTTTTGGETTSAGTSGGIDACAPEAEDDACDVCVKSECCAVLDACGLDPLCVCMINCLAGGSPPPLCASLCMPGQVYSTYLACLASQCTPPCVP